jgi:hypothetical protein
MHISLVQQGRIAQQEFAKLLVVGSRRQIHLAQPPADNDRRDFEIRVRGRFGFELAVQVKA